MGVMVFNATFKYISVLWWRWEILFFFYASLMFNELYNTYNTTTIAKCTNNMHVLLHNCTIINNFNVPIFLLVNYLLHV